MDIDFLSILKNNEILKKKKHRIKMILVKGKEFIMVTEQISKVTPLADESLYMNTKLFTEGKEYLYNEDKNYVLLPIKSPNGHLLAIIQLHRNPELEIT